MKVRTPYTEAVEELVNETRSRQFPDNITTSQALEQVDHDVVCAWVVMELSKRNPQQLLSDAFENLTDADATSVLNCLINETDTARKLLAACLREYVAKDLAYDAQTIVDRYDPEALPSSSTFASVRAEYRTMARADAAAYRRGIDDPKV